MKALRIVFGMFCLMVAVNVQSAHAQVAQMVDATFTGDNNISYWNGASWTAEGNNWLQPETLSLSVNSPSDLVYFAVSNDTSPVGSGNPSGLLASFIDTNGSFAQTGTSKLLSNSATFQVVPTSAFNANLPGAVPLSEINPTLNPTTLTGWTSASSYGTNASTSTVWGENGGVSSIDPNAQWLWTANNDGQFSTEDNYAIFSVNLGVNPAVAPEPPTLLLFVFAGAMIVLFNRKRLFPSMS